MTTREQEAIENFATGMAGRCRRGVISDFRRHIIDQQCRPDLTRFGTDGLCGVDHDHWPAALALNDASIYRAP